MRDVLAFCGGLGMTLMFLALGDLIEGLMIVGSFIMPENNVYLIYFKRFT